MNGSRTLDEEGSMISVQSITSQLQYQSIADSRPQVSLPVAKLRHHSEPDPPLVKATEDKRIKIISFVGIAADHLEDTDLPNKRQCRSLSIPNDSEIKHEWLRSQCRSRLHKPVAVRPHSGGTRGKSRPSRHHGLASVSSEVITPPESPRSRPSSASSGFFDSPLASLNNLTKKRCESLQFLPTSTSKSILPASSREGVPASIVASAKSMPSVADEPGIFGSTQQDLLRSLSQPCVSQGLPQRCATKRRRDHSRHRPAINFHKMKETSIDVGADSRFSQPVSYTCAKYMTRAFPDRILQTIASSPLDQTLPDSPTHHTFNTVSSPHPPLFDSNKDVDAVSDSGCSTTDEEVFELTDCVRNNNSGSQLPDIDQTEGLFEMDPAITDLDLDMIENN